MVFEGNTWPAYEALCQRDKRLHRNFCAMPKEMLRGDPTTGLGKPEALRHNLAGFWSRRLNGTDRLIYGLDGAHIFVPAIGAHYDKH